LDQKNKTNSTNDKKPWYKYPMVWFVIALPAIAVVASITTLVIAVKHQPIVIEQTESYKAKINPSTK
jgi:hypothetical protein